MPRKLIWTSAQDTTIKRMRAEGRSWDAVATELRVTRWTAIERGRRLGATRSRGGYRQPSEDPHRDPLPPGHPHSWDPLVQGTCLEGPPYQPVPLKA